MTKAVYKILKPHEWSEFQSKKIFSGSPDDQRDGFIHLSSEDQVKGVIERYFSNEPVLYLIKFSSSNFLELIKWEESTNGELYPHLYDAPLKLHQVEDHQEIRK